MVITIEEPKKEGLNRQLKMKSLAPFEYAVVEKEFPEPITGTSQYGTWHNFGVKVHEYLSMDPKTGDKVTEKPEESVAFFPSPKAAEQLKDYPVGVKLKIRAEEVQGKNGNYTKYIVESLDSVEEGASKENSAPSQSLNDRITALKSEGVDKQTVVETLGKEFDISDEIIGAKYEAL